MGIVSNTVNVTYKSLNKSLLFLCFLLTIFLIFRVIVVFFRILSRLFQNQLVKLNVHDPTPTLTKALLYKHSYSSTLHIEERICVNSVMHPLQHRDQYGRLSAYKQNQTINAKNTYIFTHCGAPWIAVPKTHDQYQYTLNNLCCHS